MHCKYIVPAKAVCLLSIHVHLADSDEKNNLMECLKMTMPLA